MTDDYEELSWINRHWVISLVQQPFFFFTGLRYATLTAVKKIDGRVSAAQASASDASIKWGEERAISFCMRVSLKTGATNARTGVRVREHAVTRNAVKMTGKLACFRTI